MKRSAQEGNQIALDYRLSIKLNNMDIIDRIYHIVKVFMSNLQSWPGQLLHPGNGAAIWTNATAVFKNRLFIGTMNSTDAGEIWILLPGGPKSPMFDE